MVDCVTSTWLSHLIHTDSIQALLRFCYLFGNPYVFSHVEIRCCLVACMSREMLKLQIGPISYKKAPEKKRKKQSSPPLSVDHGDQPIEGSWRAGGGPSWRREALGGGPSWRHWPETRTALGGGARCEAAALVGALVDGSGQSSWRRGGMLCAGRRLWSAALGAGRRRLAASLGAEGRRPVAGRVEAVATRRRFARETEKGER